MLLTLGTKERRLKHVEKEKNPPRPIPGAWPKLSQSRHVATPPNGIYQGELGSAATLPAHCSGLRAGSLRHGLLRGPQLYLGHLKAHEYIEVCRMLWDSWDEDAVVMDRENAVFVDASKVRRINMRAGFSSPAVR